MTDLDPPSPEPEPRSVPSEPTRRDLLAWGAAGAGACVGLGALGAVGAAVGVTPLSSAGAEARWCSLGPLEGISPGAQKLAVRAPGRDAWRRLPLKSVGRVVVVREGEELRAFNAACPHNGCDVGVGPEGRQLVCPCHRSTFALDGERVEGTSPRGLDPLEVRVVEGRVEVHFQRFVLGTPERRPV